MTCVRVGPIGQFDSGAQGCNPGDPSTAGGVDPGRGPRGERGNPAEVGVEMLIGHGIAPILMGPRGLTR